MTKSQKKINKKTNNNRHNKTHKKHRKTKKQHKLKDKIHKYVDKKTNFTQQLYSYDTNENELLEKELEIVDENVDKLTEITKRQEVNSSVVKNIITIVEDFLRTNKLICYGGTAINNILPLEDQFYDYSKEIPDYDFFSKNALNDAKRLADIYVKKGFSEVEAKSGIHTGTYKVYVNFIPIADITQLSSEIFNNLSKNTMDMFGISYAPPDYLRMAMYLELSRPKGDVSRWEKVTRRLGLLNKAFPMKLKNNCMELDFSKALKCRNKKCSVYEKQRKTALKHLIGLGVVFFGGYASSLYSKHMSKEKQQMLKHVPYYDVISQDAKRDIMLLKAKLSYEGFKDIKIKEHTSKSENIPDHYELSINDKTVAFVYQSLACHNYNIIRLDNVNIHVATIDTMLNMYLVFMFSDQKHLNNERIMCMSKFIFDLHQKNRLNQKGLFRRFNLPCLGHQDTMMDIRRKKSEKYDELKNKKDIKEFERHFLRYVPSEMNEKTGKNKTLKKKKQMKNKTNRNIKKNKPNK
jgi:hypothetical protein